MRHARKVDWSKVPDVIRYAFKVAHRPEEVFVAARMADRMHGRRGGYYAGYLRGSLFPEDWDEDQELFERIRDSAPD